MLPFRSDGMGGGVVKVGKKTEDYGLERTFEDGDVIIREGDDEREMYIIQEGEAVATKSVKDGEIFLCTMGRGQFFGEMGLMASQPRSATVRAKGHTRVVALRTGSFLVKLRRDPTFAFEIIQELCNRIRRLTDQVASLVDEGAGTARRDAEKPGRDKLDHLRAEIGRLQSLVENLDYGTEPQR